MKKIYLFICLGLVWVNLTCQNNNPEAKKQFKRLIRALEESDFETVKKIVDARTFDLDMQDNNGSTPLLLASAFNDFDSAAYLISHGAQVNVPNDNGTTPLLAATNVKLVNPQLIELLVKNGSNIHAADNNGNTPISFAAFNGLKNILAYLLHNG